MLYRDEEPDLDAAVDARVRDIDASIDAMIRDAELDSRVED